MVDYVNDIRQNILVGRYEQKFKFNVFFSFKDEIIYNRMMTGFVSTFFASGIYHIEVFGTFSSLSNLIGTAFWWGIIGSCIFSISPLIIVISGVGVIVIIFSSPLIVWNYLRKYL